MPSNLTWWQARNYAIAGMPVRRMIWYNPIVWITHSTGLFYRYEEVDTLLRSPAPADTTPHIVRHTEFGDLEFLTPDWTTLPPGGSEPPMPPGDPPPPPPPDPPGPPPGVPDPTPGGYPPTLPVPPTLPTGGSAPTGGGGGSGGFPAPILPTPGGGGGVIVVVPPVLPPDGTSGPKPPHNPPRPPAAPCTLPSWIDMSAGLDSGPSLYCAGRLTGGSGGLTWSCYAHIFPRGITVSLGSSDGTAGSLAMSGTDPTVPTHAHVGDLVTFVAKCVAGPQLAHANDILGNATVT